MRRVDALDPGTQKALIDALAKHGDDLLPMLRDVENGVNRLTSAKFKELMTALNELPTGVEGLSRWMTKLHQPDHKMFKGTLGEIEYAGKLQGELAGSGRRIAKVADTIGGKEAGDILVVTRRGQLDEIINVKNYNWANPWYQSKGNQKLLADYFSERATSLARRYAKEYGVPLGKAKDMVTIVLRGSPSSEAPRYAEKGPLAARFRDGATRDLANRSRIAACRWTRMRSCTSRPSCWTTKRSRGPEQRSNTSSPH